VTAVPLPPEQALMKSAIARQAALISPSIASLERRPRLRCAFEEWQAAVSP
jgi:hypothetical protein